MLASPPRPDVYSGPDADPPTTPISTVAAARTPRASRARRLAAGALAVVIVLQILTALGYLLVLTTIPQDVDLQTGPRPAVVGPSPAAAPTAEPAAATPALRATALQIPKLNLRTGLVDVGVDAAGVLLPPSSPDVPGWFTEAAVPGEVGPTIIAGHVDSQSGPGVFYRLEDLTPGDLVDIERSDGQQVRYRINDVATMAKDQFPTEQVYGPTAGAELRLITCGGTFDRAAGHYLRNVVVSGVLVDAA